MFHTGQFRLAGFLIALDLLGRAVVQMRPESGDLNDLVFAATAIHHMNNAKATANDEGSSEQSLHFLWRCICCNVKILRTQT